MRQCYKPLATIEVIELISLDFCDLNIKRSDYRHVEEVKEQVGRLMAEAMLKVPEFPLLEFLKLSDHILSPEKIVKLEMDEDRMFRDIDKARHLCSLSPPLSPPKPDLLVALT